MTACTNSTVDFTLFFRPTAKKALALARGFFFGGLEVELSGTMMLEGDSDEAAAP
jgi:hypothetical protein